MNAAAGSASGRFDEEALKRGFDLLAVGSARLGPVGERRDLGRVVVPLPGRDGRARTRGHLEGSPWLITKYDDRCRVRFSTKIKPGRVETVRNPGS